MKPSDRLRAAAKWFRRAPSPPEIEVLRELLGIHFTRGRFSDAEIHALALTIYDFLEAAGYLKKHPPSTGTPAQSLYGMAATNFARGLSARMAIEMIGLDA